MASFTTRLGLTKPAGTEARAVGPLNTNADLLDKFLPCILVNDGVTPPTGDLYDGALVKERTSGIIWEARKNGGGTFDKVYVRYPLQFRGATAATSYSSGTTYQACGYSSFTGGKNTSSGNITAGRFVVPVKGIYGISLKVQYSANATGSRAASAQLNGTTMNGDNEWSEMVALATAQGPFDGRIFWAHKTMLNVGDTICGALWQSSGGSLPCSNTGSITLLEPIQ